MKKMFSTLALTLLFIGSTAFAQATVIKVPVVVSGTIPCSGEFVNLNGEFQNVVHVRSDGNGGFHVTDQIHAHASGSGDFGNEYRFNLSDNFGFNVGSDGLPFTNTQTLTQNVIGKGKAPNFKVHLTAHITINNNGDVTADVFHDNITCK